MQTNIQGVYAIGDVVGGYMLAHVASREGLVAASNAMGHRMQMDYRAVPMVTFTAPQIASVGINERTLKQAGRKDYSVGKFFYRANGMAQCMGEEEGFVKIIIEEGSQHILGATLVGADASNMLSAIVPFIGQPIESMTSAIYAHPTLTEMIWEAAEDALGKAIHR
jgi:dihydrolipoamide dehydrogenase